MKLVFISDSHGLHERISIPDGDVLLHCGDFMNGGRDVSELFSFRAWWIRQPHKYKILISGNHDILMERELPLTLDFNKPEYGLFYLLDSGTSIDEIKFWGSPYTPEFFPEYWAFNRKRGEVIRKHWNLIPDDTDVLLTHGPPIGLLDQAAPSKNSDSLGCADLRMKIDSMDSLKISAFGHIHGSSGQRKYGGKTFINASQVNESYKVVNKPIVIDL